MKKKIVLEPQPSLGVLRVLCGNTIAFLGVLGVLGGEALAAENYPARPIRMLIPSPPGGGTDILGRLVKDGLTDLWKQPIVADNRGGASGRIAAQTVAK